MNWGRLKYIDMHWTVGEGPCCAISGLVERARAGACELGLRARELAHIDRFQVTHGDY